MKKPRVRFTFDPAQRGIRKLLGDLEADVMEEIWRSGSTTVRDVHRSLQPRRELAYTTVMTVVTRLAEKGLLVRQEKEGAAWTYAPAMSRAEFLRSAARSILSGVMRDFGEPAMSEFVDLVKSDEQIEELARLVARKKKERS